MIIAVMGKAGSGKDEFAKILGELIPVRRYAFADKLKFVATSLGWNGEKDEKGRKLLQDLGQCFRAYNKNTWVDIVINQIKDFDTVALPCVYVITDVRFPDEIERLKEEFNKVITVKLVGRQDDIGVNAEDISENALNDYTAKYVIYNNGDLSHLRDEIQRMLVMELN